MSAPKSAPSAALRTSWYALLAAAATAPLFAGALPYGPRITYDVFFSLPTLMLGLMLCVSLGAWLWALGRKETTLRWNKTLCAVATLAVLAGLSTAFALYKPLALIGDTQDSAGLVAWLLCSSAAFLVTQHVTGNERLKVLARAVVYGAGIVALLALIQRITNVDPMGLVTAGTPLEWMNHRGSSTLGNPDFLGNYLVGPAVLALGLQLDANRTSRGRILDASLFVLISVGCVASLTRGAWAGLLVASVFLLFAIRKDRAKVREGAALVAIALVLALLSSVAISGSAALTARLSPQTPSTGTSVESSQPAQIDENSLAFRIDSALSGRLGTWGEALAITKSHPLLGVGPANYRLGWYPVQGVTGLNVSGTSFTGDPHSLPLLVSATLGIPAVVVLILALAFALGAQGRSTLKDGSGRRAVYSAWWASLIGVSTASIAGSTTTPFLMMIFVALAAVASASAKDVVAVKRGVATGVTAVVLIGCVSLTSMVGILTVAQTRLWSSFKTANLAALDAAAETAPWSLSVQETYLTTVDDLALSSLPSGGQVARDYLVTAIKKNDAAVERVPLNYEFAYQKSTLLLGAGQIVGEPYLSDGLAAVDKALELSPISLTLRTKKASVLIDLDRSDEAVALLEDYWYRDRGDDLAGSTYVTALAVSGRFDDAQSALDVLEARFPNSAAVAEAKANLEKLRGE